ncbi:zinc finger protein [Trichonephila clavata]|uniref:Zinc finger protein n=1 Tax=Trichonephila clavata TaxID=2740835 RepID=A0A8X6L809_TRICU|nr:zinc finger protein [Trichonephila clavata]
MFVVNATKIENGPTQLTVVPHVCSICKKAFLQHKTLEEHFKTHLDGERQTEADASSCPNDEKEVLKTANKLHTCGALEQHYLVHSGERPFSCNLCSRSFKQKSHRDKHLQTHIGQDLSNTSSSNSNELVLPSDTSVKEWIDDGAQKIKIENTDE